jgi:hypothetical protein
MNNSNGVYPLRLRQRRAIAENLCRLADRHPEDHNYVVAYALYTRALSVAQQIHIPENDGNVLVARIRTDQQAAFDLLRIGESGLREIFFAIGLICSRILKSVHFFHRDLSQPDSRTCSSSSRRKRAAMIPCLPKYPTTWPGSFRSTTGKRPILLSNIFAEASCKASSG